MELNNNNISKQYEEKLQFIDNRINILLDEFKKIYVVIRMNPNDHEYQQQYQNIINSISEMLSKLFSLSNDVQVNINNINKKLFELNTFIQNEKNKNGELKKKLGMIKNTGNASSEMIYDYKNIYNYNYLRNWSLFISSLLCIGAINIIYKKKV
jgi:ABC-type enterochelin transport system substrate-binding protein